MSLSNLPAHVKLLAIFVAAALVIGVAGAYGYVKMGQRNARLEDEKGQQTQRKQEFEKLAGQLEVKEDEFQNAAGDLLHLDIGLSRDEYVPTLLEQFRLFASQSRLMLASFRPGQTVAPPPPAKEKEEGEKAFEAEVGEMLLGTVVGKEPWAVIEAFVYYCSSHPEEYQREPGKCPECKADLLFVSKKEQSEKEQRRKERRARAGAEGQAEKEEEPDYDALREGATLTTKSKRRGKIKKISQSEVVVKYKEKDYPVKVPKREAGLMKLDLALEGTYEDFQRFLRSMNRFPKLVKIEQVSVAKAGEEAGRLRFRISTQLFFVPEEVEKVLAKAKAPTGAGFGDGRGTGWLPGLEFGFPGAGPLGQSAVRD